MPALATSAAPRHEGTAPTVTRAYSVLSTHAVEEARDYWIVRGTATAPGTNRVGDSVNPLGARYTLPLPFIWQHAHTEPVGSVVAASASAAGIAVEIHIPKVHTPGRVKDRVDEAVHSIQHGIVRGLSIGISANPDDWEFNDRGGIDFRAWDWLELSGVTVPAHKDATISLIHSIAQASAPASGHSADATHTSPGVSGSPGNRVVRLQSTKEATVADVTKTVSEQIAAFRTARTEKAEAMHSIMSAAAEKGETLDAEQSEQYDTLDAEVSEIDKHLARLGRLEAQHAASARSAVADSNAAAARSVATGSTTATETREIRVKARQKEPGIAFAQYAKVLGVSHLRRRDPERVAQQMYPDDSQVLKLAQHDAVKAGSTESGNWAAKLVGEETGAFADFVEFLRPQTILGRFGRDGIPSLRGAPFRTPLVSQTGGGDGYWVGEGKAKPLTSFDFDRKTLEPLKVANIAVLTRELLSASSPAADMLVRDSLAAALRERLDRDFIDPNKNAGTGSPASILFAPTGIASSGVDAQAVRDDIQALFASFIAANNAPTSGVWIMPATTALALSLMQNPLGQAEFPGVNMRGGTLFGIPVIVSEYVPTVTAGAVVALVNASDIYLGDEGGVTIDISTEASLEMDNAPTHDSVTPTETTLVSMFQTNSVAFLAERTINWMARRPSAAAYLHSVNWGVGVT